MCAAREADQTAKQLLANAYGFFLAATRIADGGVGPGFPWPPFFVNIGHAFELSFKAYVVHHGGNEKVCRNDIGHDLFRAIDEACARGLSRPTQDVLDLISIISPYHRGHNFRYLTTPIDTPSLPNVVETLALTRRQLISIAGQAEDLLSDLLGHEDLTDGIPHRGAQTDVQEAPTQPQQDSRSAADPFVDNITRERTRLLNVVASATEAYETELEEQFDDDLSLRQRLSAFARNNDLDAALTALWDEIKHYPAWSRRDDFAKWNTLKLSGIAGVKDNDTETVEFVHEGRRFSVIRRKWSEQDTSYADFAFLEEDDEMFAISCMVEYGEYSTTYDCFDIRAFKKRGAWARVLLHYYSELLIQENRFVAKLGYEFAEEIPERFQE